MQSLIESYQYDIVVYDEIENFKDYMSPDSDYPYEKRKTTIGWNSFEPILTDYSYSYK